jgi:hypothetical protein
MKTPRNARFGNPIDRENGLDVVEPGTELVADLFELGTQAVPLVQEVDQIVLAEEMVEMMRGSSEAFIVAVDDQIVVLRA